MKKQIKLNGNVLSVPEFTFNTMIELEDRGVSLSGLNDTPMKFIRAIIALSLEITDEEAGMEIQRHLQSGGKLDDVIEAVTESITESGFIKALQNE